MSVGSWDPNLAKPDSGVAVSPELLARFIALSREEQLDSIAANVDGKQQQLYAELMTLPQRDWEAAVGNMLEADIYHLMRFFTMAEMQLAGWEAGDKSPVIWLNKILKMRDKPLSKDQIQWIKQHTRNRFLPYGSAL